MKRFFAIALVIVMIAALLCACGGNNGKTDATGTTGTVTTTVNSKYDDGYATKYASKSTVDEAGNKVYEFEGSQYDSYVDNHKNSIASDIQREYVANHDEKYGEYVYINNDSKSVIVGIHEGEYDEKTAEDEAKKAAEYGFKYFQNLKEPVSSLKVVYCNAGDQTKIYGSFDFNAE